MRSGPARVTHLLALLTSADSTDVSDPDTAAFVEAYAALEDFLAAHPDGLPPELVAVYGQDVRECRRLWDAARARTSEGHFPDTCGGGDSGSGLPGRALAAEALDEARPTWPALARRTSSGTSGRFSSQSSRQDPRSCAIRAGRPKKKGWACAPPSP